MFLWFLSLHYCSEWDFSPQWTRRGRNFEWSCNGVIVEIFMASLHFYILYQAGYHAYSLRFLLDVWFPLELCIGGDNSLYKIHGHIFWEFCVKPKHVLICIKLFKNALFEFLEAIAVLCYQRTTVWKALTILSIRCSKKSAVASPGSHQGLTNQSSPNPSDSIKREETICNSHKPLFDK